MSIFSQSHRSLLGLPSYAAVVLLALLCPPLLVGLLVWQEYSIALILAGVVLLGIVVAMLAQPERTTAAVFFVVYANLAVVAINTYNVPSMLAASVVLLLGLPLLQYLLVRREPIVFNRIAFMMVGYLGVLLISAAFSANAAQSMPRIQDFLFEGIILYLLILNTVRTPTVLRLVIWAMLLAGVLMGSLSIYQEVTGAYDNDFGGLSVISNAQMDTGQVDAFGDEISRGRVEGPVGEKNRYAQIMVVLLPLALSRLWAERTWLLRLLGAATAIPIMGGALLTFSRGAGVAVIITLLVMVALRAVKWWQLALVAVAGYLTISLVAPDYLYRLSTATDVADLATDNASQAGGSVRGRATASLAALYIFLDHPILGVGPGQTRYYTFDYGNEVGFRRLEGERRAHNMYLEELADTGVIGFTVFMGIIGLTMHQLWRLRRQWWDDPATLHTITGLFLAVIAYLGAALFLHLSYMRYYWLLLALAAAAYEIWKKGPARQPSADGALTPTPSLTPVPVQAVTGRRPFVGDRE